MSFLSSQKQLFNNETFRNGFFFTAFSFINKGMNFILLILLAKFITPTEYGYWSLFGTIVMFMGYFIAMTTQGYILISYFKEFKRSSRSGSRDSHRGRVQAFELPALAGRLQRILRNRYAVARLYQGRIHEGCRVL